MNKPLTLEEFESIYRKVPRLCVELVIKTEEGVLMTLRTLPSYHNMWHIPGVTLHYEESIEDAIQRVAGDELGVSVIVDSLLDYIEYRSEKKDRGFGHAVSVVFLCRQADPSAPIVLNDEASEYKYFKKASPNIIPEHATFLVSKGFLVK